MRRVRRPSVRDGYDRWAATYDQTQNPLVALDDRHTLGALAPCPGERVLDAACGTGRHLRGLEAARATAFGLDLSHGMLTVARRHLPGSRLAQADLHQPLPVERGAFDAVLCALVGEHLKRLRHFFTEAHAALRPGGRLVFSTFHPEPAQGGVEANFEQDGAEYRLGAERHSIADYLGAAEDGGFASIVTTEVRVDEALAAQVPSAKKHLGRPLLLLIEARRAS